MKSILITFLATSVLSSPLFANSDHINHDRHTKKVKSNVSVQEQEHSPHKQSLPLPIESGQSIFGAISEINQLLEERNIDWASVDLDAVMEHLRDMDNLMLSTEIEKISLPNGLVMTVSNINTGQRAMDNMIPAHSIFLRRVRPKWDIQYDKRGLDYTITVTSVIKEEAVKIKALGFSGFMIQDNHHPSHHIGLALKQKTH